MTAQEEDNMPQQFEQPQAQQAATQEDDALATTQAAAQTESTDQADVLDDILDKLDAGRVEQLIRLVGDDGFGQIFITDCNPTRLRTILDKTGDDYSLFTVENGGIVR